MRHMRHMREMLQPESRRSSAALHLRGKCFMHRGSLANRQHNSSASSDRS
jgi:hypothetical protein